MQPAALEGCSGDPPPSLLLSPCPSISPVSSCQAQSLSPPRDPTCIQGTHARLRGHSAPLPAVCSGLCTPRCRPLRCTRLRAPVQPGKPLFPVFSQAPSAPGEEGKGRKYVDERKHYLATLAIITAIIVTVIAGTSNCLPLCPCL